MLAALQTRAQFPNFVNYAQDEGLPQSYIYSISQDDLGFLWLGTGNGFSRFDGHQFKTYNIKDNLPEDFVTASLVDSRGNLWVGHYQGEISKFNFSQNKFITVPTDENKRSRINQILEIPDGSILFVTQNSGIIKITADGNLIPIENKTESFFYSVQPYQGNKLLIGTNNGLIIGDLFNDEIQNIRRPLAFVNQKVNTIVPNKFGEGYWLGTDENGLYLFESEQKFRNISTREGLSSDDIKCIFPKNEHQLWVGTSDAGVNLLVWDNQENEINSITTYSTKNNLPDDHILSIFADKEENIWVGTNGGGLARYTGEKFALENEGFPSPFVNAIYQDNAKNYWYATDKGIVKHLNLPEGKEIIYYNEILGLDSLAGSAILQDKNGNMWLGFKEGGLYFISEDGDSIQNFYDRDDFQSRMINDLTLDKEGNIWVATRLNGVYYYNFKKNTFRRYSTNEGFLHNNISDLFCDSKGRIWISSSVPGLSYFEDEVFFFLNDNETIRGIEFNCITENGDGNIWLGSDGNGLFAYNGETFTNFTTSEGLLSNYIYSIGCDKKNDLWVGSRNGLTRLNTSTLVFEQFKNDLEGLAGIETSTNAFYLEPSTGKAYFGVNRGVLVYDPLEDKLNEVKPNVYITGLYVFDDKVDINQDVVLPPGQYRIRFDFLGVSFKEPQKMRYKYLLEGHDLEWSEATSETTARYPRIEDGTYTLRVKAANSDGIWNEQATTFSFEIQKPFWKEWWFYGILAVAFLSGVYIYNKIRLRNLIISNRQLEEKVAIRTEELNNEKVKLEKANVKLDHQKTEIEEAYHKLVDLEKFKETLINMIVHDLKNPLNAVISLTEGSPIVQQAGRQMLHMVMNILETSKFEEADMHLNIKTCNMRKVVEIAMNQVGLLVQQKGLRIKKEFRGRLWVKADDELIVRVLVNLLTNAIKFTDPGGEIKISGEIKKEDNHSFVFIAIKDTGSGINPDFLPAIFDKFSQFESKDLGNTKSTGIGLTFCKMAVEAHNGKIGVTSEVGRGSTFYFYLPMEEKVVKQGPNGKHTELENDEELYAPVQISLSEKDKTVLTSLVGQLKTLEIYDTSDHIQLLENMQIESGEIAQWKEEIEQSVLSFNEKRYKELLELASN
ncbi:ligand-binding sensor domain-containing protein [Flexithrix dorotheae]|uniref:ligand-binding sensor domain-containing protein n=1 Tax=Flexithrix dorotheae TaxID=70993 RepID=UPI00036D8A34|nr:two-component regulator propeller domain-containing protein [Flexithrix dorotheae]